MCHVHSGQLTTWEKGGIVSRPLSMGCMGVVLTRRVPPQHNKNQVPPRQKTRKAPDSCSCMPGPQLEDAACRAVTCKDTASTYTTHYNPHKHTPQPFCYKCDRRCTESCSHTGQRTIQRGRCHRHRHRNEDSLANGPFCIIAKKQTNIFPLKGISAQHFFAEGNFRRNFC